MEPKNNTIVLGTAPLPNILHGTKCDYHLVIGFQGQVLFLAMPWIFRAESCIWGTKYNTMNVPVTENIFLGAVTKYNIII